MTKKKLLLYLFISVLLLPFSSSFADFVNLGKAAIKDFQVEHIYSDHLDLKLKLENRGHEKEKIKIGFEFLNKQNEVLRKDNDREIELEPDEKDKIILLNKEITGLNGLDKIKVVLVNDSGFELMSGTIDNLSNSVQSIQRISLAYGNKNRRVKKKIEIKENTCELNEKEAKILCSDLVDDPSLIQIYKNSVYGEEVYSNDNPWKVVNNKSEFQIPKLKDGKYEIEVYIKGRRGKYFNYIVGNKKGQYVSIQSVKWKDSDEKKDGRIELVLDKNFDKIKVAFGILNESGEACLFVPDKNVTLVNGYNLITFSEKDKNDKCYGNKKIFLFVMDEKGKVLDSYNADGKNLNYFNPKKLDNIAKSLSTDKIDNSNEYEKYTKYILYIAGGLLFLGLILWFVNKTAAISLIILALLLFAGFFGYQKILAYALEEKFIIQDNGMKISIANKTKYNKDESKKMTLVYGDNQDKGSDLRIEFKVDNGDYKPRIKYEDHSSVYNINLEEDGSLTPGNHKVYIQAYIESKFGLERFGNSKFGEYPLAEVVKEFQVRSDTEKDVEWCLVNQTDPDCHCGDLRPKPNEVCIGQTYTATDGCGEAMESIEGEGACDINGHIIGSGQQYGNSGNNGNSGSTPNTSGSGGNGSSGSNGVTITDYSNGTVSDTYTNIINTMVCLLPEFGDKCEDGHLKEGNNAEMKIEYNDSGHLEIENNWKEYQWNSSGFEILEGKKVSFRMKIIVKKDGEEEKTEILPVDNILNDGANDTNEDQGDLQKIEKDNHNPIVIDNTTYYMYLFRRTEADKNDNKNRYKIVIRNSSTPNQLYKIKVVVTDQGVQNN